MKNFIVAIALLVALILPSIAYGAGIGSIVEYKNKGAKVVGWTQQYTVKVQNNGPDADRIRVEFNLPEEFIGNTNFFGTNTTGTTITCSGPPFNYCQPVGFMPVGSYYVVTYTGHWSEAGTFNWNLCADHDLNSPCDDTEPFTFVITP